MAQQKELDRLKQEIMLQINQQLYEKSVITREVYETAKVRILHTS